MQLDFNGNGSEAVQEDKLVHDLFFTIPVLFQEKFLCAAVAN